MTVAMTDALPATDETLLQPKRILIVEDTQAYVNAAMRYFAGRSGVEPSFAFDYDDAMKLLGTASPYNGALIDCFFPYRAGSNDTSLGREVVARMVAEDPREVQIRKAMDELDEFIDTKDLELAVNLRNMLYQNPDSCVVRALKQTSTVLDRKGNTHIAKNTLRLYAGRPAPDYYSALEKAMNMSEENQLLGILVAKHACGAGLPFVLVTSTHHHDNMTQPIENMANAHGWTLIDCAPGQPHEKARPEFWERAYDALRREMGELD